MGIKKALKRRHRRQQRQGKAVRHQLRSGRTGSVYHKQRRGALHELRKKKRREMKDGEVINGEFMSADRIWSPEDIRAQVAQIQVFRDLNDDDLLKAIVFHAKESVRQNFLGHAATEELERRGGITDSLKALAVKKGVI